MLRGRIEIQNIDNGLLLRYTQVNSEQGEYKVVFCKDKVELLTYLSNLDLDWDNVDD